MPITFRHYTNSPGVTEDSDRIRNFLITLGTAEFTYARWDWMITHTSLDQSAVGKIGMWEHRGALVGVATFDCQLGTAYCLTLPAYSSLKKEMLQYAEDHFAKNGEFSIVIADTDYDFQQMAAELGYIATKHRENDSVFYPDATPVQYELPPGFTLTGLDESLDLFQYGRVLWKGFNHELNGEGEYLHTPEHEQALKAEMLRPHVDLKLKVAAITSDGNLAAYCGMWYEPEVGYAVVEPVATDPAFRKQGLGKAVVLEGIRRVHSLGAKTVLVGSSQTFYYRIGFRPYASATLWRKK
ncbi:acetyltransferase (GNAT) family protein [Fontibacillus phaseoli]|uniref:Acetyltransferase (GNAT) family protein n=1 Tax=Fontibacillus phaseoli TaxID=1416533 RepID=A0A369B5A6_9BACL|nr:GNAT family N-acetyltransferase [Fontibacillus phaseoli]RCX16700.1 acetyltransferase (GNAT) family protein [Fontibacillus phaseoli]